MPIVVAIDGREKRTGPGVVALIANLGRLACVKIDA
jgi:hypothetical protein